MTFYCLPVEGVQVRHASDDIEDQQNRNGSTAKLTAVIVEDIHPFSEIAAVRAN